MNKKDLKLIIVLVLVSCVIFCMFKFFKPQDTDLYVQIQSNTKTTRYDINVNQVINVDNHLKVEINNKTVKVIEADCKDKICQNHKKILSSGESIICMPNNIIIQIKGRVEKYDAISE